MIAKIFRPQIAELPHAGTFSVIASLYHYDISKVQKQHDSLGKTADRTKRRLNSLEILDSDAVVFKIMIGSSRSRSAAVTADGGPQASDSRSPPSETAFYRRGFSV
jgi:hypothetical protein